MLRKFFCLLTKRQTLKLFNGINLAEFFHLKPSITIKFSDTLMPSTQVNLITKTRAWRKRKFHLCARNLLKNHSHLLKMKLRLIPVKHLEARGLEWCSLKVRFSSLLSKKNKGLIHLEWAVGPKILQKEILEA